MFQPFMLTKIPALEVAVPENFQPCFSVSLKHLSYILCTQRGWQNLNLMQLLQLSKK